VEENLGPKVTKPVTGADASNAELPRCPTCGSTRYHRTHRTRLEHFLSRPAMARCEKCGLRFPYPGHRDGSSGPAELEEAAAPVIQPSKERRSPEIAEESSKPKVTEPDMEADSSNGELPRCPTCGGTRYHRTRRTALERFLSRPAMARCETCGLRFPYPGRPEGSSGSVELEEAPVLQPSEERRSPEMAEESSRAEVTKPVTDADASNGELPRCPTCGGTRYYRTHRTRLERFLSRPPMARCEKCEARFPYPRQHEG